MISRWPIAIYIMVLYRFTSGHTLHVLRIIGERKRTALYAIIRHVLWNAFFELSRGKVQDSQCSHHVFRLRGHASQRKGKFEYLRLVDKCGLLVLILDLGMRIIASSVILLNEDAMP